jgi:hypothetical protein
MLAVVKSTVNGSLTPVLGGATVNPALSATATGGVPADAPIGFARKRWHPRVFADGGIDRKFYELCPAITRRLIRDAAPFYLHSLISSSLQ